MSCETIGYSPRGAGRVFGDGEIVEAVTVPGGGAAVLEIGFDLKWRPAAPGFRLMWSLVAGAVASDLSYVLEHVIFDSAGNVVDEINVGASGARSLATLMCGDVGRDQPACPAPIPWPRELDCVGSAAYEILRFTWANAAAVDATITMTIPVEKSTVGCPKGTPADDDPTGSRCCG